MKLVIFFIVISYNLVVLECTERPIIGILSQEICRTVNRYYPATNYIAASYVKAVEAGGARVAPIFIGRNVSYYRAMLRSINGIIFPGGGTTLEPNNGYYDAVTIIYKLAKEINSNKTFFPILGICLGFEALLITSNNNTNIQKRCDIMHQNYPLTFAKNFRQSLTFAKLPEELFIYLKYFDVTKNYHKWCTTQVNFTKHSLDKQWLITSTSISSHGLEFISTIEHKRYPFIGVQFHPEKQYEWNPEQRNPHSKISIKANRYFFDLIVDLAKLNNNAFSREKDERKSLIYNYFPRPNDVIYDQIYVFK